LNPRSTFQHLRDFQSRSLDHSDTSPERAQRNRHDVSVELNRGVLVTGANGQLGAALCEEFGAVTPVFPLTRADWDVTLPPPPGLPEVDLVLHAAAWTDVDGAEESPQDAAAVNVGGTQHVRELGVPMVLFSTDYVFDGRKREPYVESDAPAPLSVYGRTKLQSEAVAGDEAWIVRTSWLHGWTGTNFVRTMLRLGAERDEVAVVDDQRGSPTYVGHLAAAVRSLIDQPPGLWHLSGGGDCTWAEFAEAIFEDAGLDCRVRRISSAELVRPAKRPAYSVLQSERPEAPELPHWREGLRACLRRLA
jgi:dTDP-4-dehydrorhamnose reductase